MGENWIKVVKKYKFPITRLINTGAVMYYMMTVANTTV